MTRSDITRALDEEIARLQHVKELLQGTKSLTPAVQRIMNGGARTTRVMSEEGRRRIAEAQKRRWAKQKGTQ